MPKKAPNSHSPVDKPHDKLVRRLLSNVATAREVLETYLPAEIKALMDLNFLERQPDTFVDSEHRIKEVDVLFKARTKNGQEEVYIWLLIEQQRDPDVWLPLRQFCYIGVIWDHIRKASKSRAKSNKLPFIYPLIISNAGEPYSYSLTLSDMIEPKEAQPLFGKLFSTPSCLIDLAALPDEKLRQSLQEQLRAQALLLSLKHVFDKNLQSYLETVLLSSFKTLDQLGYSDDVADLLYYLYNEGNLNNSSAFWHFLHQKFSKKVEDAVMTLGQQAIKEATQQAKHTTLQETALRMLDEKFDIQVISRITHLSPEEIKQLAKKKTN